MDSRHRAYDDGMQLVTRRRLGQAFHNYWFGVDLRYRCSQCFAGLLRIFGRLFTAYWYSLLLVLLFSVIIVEMTFETTFGALVFYGAVKRPEDFYARLRWKIVTD